jgi:hypothetical protein
MPGADGAIIAPPSIDPGAPMPPPFTHRHTAAEETSVIIDDPWTA